MPDLGNTAPASTYPYLLQIDGGLDSALRSVEDGDGTALPFKVSESELSVDAGIVFTLLDGLVSFTTSSTTIKLGKTGATDDYTIHLPASMPVSANKFLKVDSVSSDTATLSWDNATGDGLLLDGSTVSSTLQVVQDKNGDDTALFIATDKLRSNGHFSILGLCQIYNVGAANYVALKAADAQSIDYTIIFPDSMPADTSRVLGVSGLDNTTKVVTTSWADFSDIPTLDSNNVYTNENEFQAGIFLSGGPFRFTVSSFTAQTSVTLTESGSNSSLINVFIPVSVNTVVTLPPGVANICYFISHGGTSLQVVVKDSGGSTLKTLTAGQKFIFIYSGSAWVVW